MKPITENSQILKQIIKEGIPENKPQNLQEVYFFYALRTKEGQNLICSSEKSPTKVTVGNQETIQGLEQIIYTMNIGEKCQFEIPASLAYGEQGLNDIVPKNADISGEIEIIRFGSIRSNRWELLGQYKLDSTNQLKQQGNDFIKQQNYAQAQNRYELAIKTIQDDQSEQMVQLKANLISNLSLVYLKLKEYEKCISVSQKALQLQPDNIKVIYRKGCAEAQAGKFEEAKTTFNYGLQLDPQNVDFTKELNGLNALKKQFKEKETKTYQNMFK